MVEAACYARSDEPLYPRYRFAHVDTPRIPFVSRFCNSHRSSGIVYASRRVLQCCVYGKSGTAKYEPRDTTSHASSAFQRSSTRSSPLLCRSARPILHRSRRALRSSSVRALAGESALLPLRLLPRRNVLNLLQLSLLVCQIQSGAVRLSFTTSQR